MGDAGVAFHVHNQFYLCVPDMQPLADREKPTRLERAQARRMTQLGVEREHQGSAAWRNWASSCRGSRSFPPPSPSEVGIF